MAIQTKKERVQIIISHMTPEVIEKINAKTSWTPKRVAEWLIDAQDNNLIDKLTNVHTTSYVAKELPFTIYMKADEGIVDIKFNLDSALGIQTTTISMSAVKDKKQMNK